MVGRVVYVSRGGGRTGGGLEGSSLSIVAARRGVWLGHMTV